MYTSCCRQIVKDCVNASDEDVVIFTGSGATSAIHKLIHALKLERERVKKTVRPVAIFII